MFAQVRRWAIFKNQKRKMEYPMKSQRGDDPVSLARLKDTVRRLPADSTTKAIILAEKDVHRFRRPSPTSRSSTGSW
jgi:hypothetical protein